MSQRGVHYALILLAGTLGFLWNLGGAALWDVDEGRNATCSLEMYESGNYVVPTFNGGLRPHKPVLMNWLQALCYRTFGISEFSARFPSAVAALLTLLVAYELARSLFEARTGLLAGLILVSAPMQCFAARFANPDALLNLFVVLTMTIFWWGRNSTSRSWFFLLGVVVGGAILAKGPVGFLLPGAILFLYSIWVGRWRMLLTPWLGFSLLGCLLVAGPWYGLVTAETKGRWLREFLFVHNFNRAMAPLEDHSGGPFYYVVILFGGLVPWSIFLCPALWFGGLALRKPTSEANSNEAGNRDAYKFLLLWAGVFVVSFSVAATKLPNYVLPAAVPLAILIGRFLERWRVGELHIPRYIEGIGLTSLLLIGAAVGGLLLLTSGSLGEFSFQTRTFPGLEKWAFLGLIPVVGAVVAGWFWLRHQRNGYVVAVAMTAILFVAPLAAWANAAFNRFKATHNLVALGEVFRPTEDIVVGAFCLESWPSLNFYVQRDVVHINDAGVARVLLSRRNPMYLFVPTATWNECRDSWPAECRELGRWGDLYRHREVTLITTRPVENSLAQR